VCDVSLSPFAGQREMKRVDILTENSMFLSIPLDCRLCILTFLSPKDICRASEVSIQMQVACEVDALWEKYFRSPTASMKLEISQCVPLKEIYIELYSKKFARSTGLDLGTSSVIICCMLKAISCSEMYCALFSFFNAMRYLTASFSSKLTGNSVEQLEVLLSFVGIFVSVLLMLQVLCL
jgi:hypothetical protein